MKGISVMALAVLSTSALVASMMFFTNSVNFARPRRSSTSPAVDISFWTSGPTQGLAGIVAHFNRQYAGRYAVSLKVIPYTNETEMVNSALTSHRAPDIMEESLTYSLPYALQGLEMPIGPILKMGGVNPGNFPASLWKGMTVHGVHYVAPTDALPTLMFWNKSLFRAAGLNPNTAPKTMQQFIADARKLTNPKKKQWGFVQATSLPDIGWQYASFVSQFGGRLANPAVDKATFNSTPGIKALMFMKDLIYKYHVSPTDASNNEDVNLFLDGKDAIIFAGSPNYPSFYQKYHANLGVAQLPIVGKHEADFLGNNYWWVFRNPNMTTQKEKGIGLFMKYFYTHSLGVADQGILPVWRPILKTPMFQKSANLKVQVAALNTGILHPLIPWGAVKNFLFNNMNEVLLNKMPVQQALSQATQEIDQTLAQSNQ